MENHNNNIIEEEKSKVYRYPESVPPKFQKYDDCDEVNLDKADSHYKNSIGLGNNSSGFCDFLPSSVHVPFFSAPSVQLGGKKRYCLCCSKLFVLIFSVIILISLFGKHPIHNRNRWCNSEPKFPWKGPTNFTFDPDILKNFQLEIKGYSLHGHVIISRSPKAKNVTIDTKILLNSPHFQDFVTVVTHEDRVTEKFSLLINSIGYGVRPACIFVQVEIKFPESLKYFGDLILDTFNTKIATEDMKGLIFEKVKWRAFDDSHIQADNLQARQISIYSNSKISGSYLVSDSLTFHTSNAEIDTILFEAHTVNGKIFVEITEPDEEVDSSGSNTIPKISLDTTNGNIEGSYYVNGEWQAATSSGNIEVEIYLPNDDDVSNYERKITRITGQTSNGHIIMDVSDEYQGRFHMATSNGKTEIKGGHDIQYTIDTKQMKTGYKGDDDTSQRNNELVLFSSNGKAILSFF
ncbi:7162_t:CDS:2 [Ambispora gerdemannii]|uniref:7162_t:CDS:1 n=1 Tax=Ambispora gerdemannii TaxID=144530 RepID=A0A9N8YL36_9GLOM|nr:7162_t:CDS:2 [Ambispora gerdemannii]